MLSSEQFLYRDPWCIYQVLDYRPNNIYICLSGNSGCGKSTKLRFISQVIYKKDNQTIAIDEKHLHHPFLPSLFHEPDSYGFQIQLNFMLQRSLLIKKWIDLGYNLVMERSHIEDQIFIRHLYKKGLVNKKEYDAYLNIWNCINARTPNPNYMIYLNYGPEKSLENISNDEISGKRPKEFSSESSKRNWIYSWHEMYTDFFYNAKDFLNNTIFFEIKKESDFSSNIINEIVRYIR